MSKHSLNSSHILVCLLGTPRIEGPEGVLTGPVAQRHRLALLALLATAPNYVLSREKLIGLLWPENDATTSRQLLNVSVHAIRKALGDGVLRSEGDALHIDAAVIRVDVVEFEAALARGDAARAVELYPGPFLESLGLPDAVEFDHWADQERDRLQHRFNDALDQLAEAATAAGDHQQAVARWRQRLTHTPADARAVVRLMLALEQAGDRAGALQAADAHRSLMTEEFQAEPDPQVTSLAALLRAGQGPALRTSLPFPDETHTTPDGPGKESYAGPPMPGRWSGARWIAAGLAVAAIIVLVGVPLVGRFGRNLSDRIVADIRATRIIQMPEVLDSASHLSSNPVANDLLLRARKKMERTLKDLDTATTLLTQALQIDTGFHEARAYLARALIERTYWHGAPLMWADSGMRIARQVIDAAPDLAVAHAALGLGHLEYGRLTMARSAYQRAVKLDAGNAEAIMVLGWIEMLRGNLAEAARYLHQARSLDRNTAMIARDLGVLYKALGEPLLAGHWRSVGETLDSLNPLQGLSVLVRSDTGSEIMRVAENAVSTSDSSYRALELAGRAAFKTGAYQRAIQHFDAMYRINAQDWNAWGLTHGTWYGLSLLYGGEQIRGTEVLRDVIADGLQRINDGDERGGVPREIAVAHAALGDRREALRWFRKAIEAGWRLERLEQTPLVGLLNEDPAFQTLVRQMNADLERMSKQIAEEIPHRSPG